MYGRNDMDEVAIYRKGDQYTNEIVSGINFRGSV
jgi:hypothetical protein